MKALAPCKGKPSSIEMLRRLLNTRANGKGGVGQAVRH
jgi:hypothetical protein